MRNSLSIYDRSPLWNWMRGDTEDFFDQVWTAKPFARQLPYHWQEMEGAYLLGMDLPGIAKENLKIELVEQNLTLSGERKRAGDSGGQKFSYEFTVPSSVDASKIEAKLQDGVLEVLLPKAEAAKPRLIEIQSGN